METEAYCLHTTNYENKRIIFLEKTRQIKARKHPELRGEAGDKFINGRVKETVKNPHFIYEDFVKPNERLVYYYLEYGGDRNRYTKVVVTKNGNPLYILTAFRPDYVKERGQSALLYGQDR